MDYTQITPLQCEEMLETIGISSIDTLFQSIDEGCRYTGMLPLPAAASELELQQELLILAEDNAAGSHTHSCFMGAGSYDHFIPVLIDQIISRGEFLTAYTPYQAEASQGSLQAFFEFQTQIVRLTGMDIANASMYDGATAVAEAAILAVNYTGKRRVLVASTIHPDYMEVLKTYTSDLAIDLVVLDDKGTGCISADTVQENIDEDTACVVIQSPNFYGLIENWTDCFGVAHSQKKTLAVAIFNPIACGLFKQPGECGADIAVGEGQPLGIPLQYGGPYLGLFAAKENLMRKMPGRLVGETVDKEGRRAFCLALQTREQHIKREKATSNICTNQGLLALRATMFLNAVGPQGLAEMAEQCYHKAHYLAKTISDIPGFSIKYITMDNPDSGGDGNGSFFHEFVVVCPVPAGEIISCAREMGLLLGPALDTAKAGRLGAGNELLVCVTEKRIREELDLLVDVLKSIPGKN